MAKSAEIQKKLAEFQKQHSGRQAKAQEKFSEAGVTPPQNTNNSKSSIDEKSTELNVLKDRLAQVEQELKEKDSVIKKYQQQEQTAENVKNQRAISDIINGYDQEFFEKDYEFPMEGGKPLKFHVKMRASNVFDYARIEQEVINMCDGQIDYDRLHETSHLLDALATLRVVGVEIPKWLSEGTNFNPAILLQVYSDWTEWLATFLKRQR